MRFWSREVAGWVLVALGLGVFYVCFELMLQHHIVEAAVMGVIGVFIYRGGIHLLKVAVAARVCLEARERAEPKRTTSARKAKPRAAGISSLIARRGP